MIDSERVMLEVLSKVRNKDVSATNELVRAIEPLIEKEVLPPDIYLGVKSDLEGTYTSIRAVEKTVQIPLQYVSYSAVVCAINALQEELRKGIEQLRSEYNDYDIISTGTSLTHVVDSWNDQKLGVRCVMEFVVIKRKKEDGRILRKDSD